MVASKRRGELWAINLRFLVLTAVTRQEIRDCTSSMDSVGTW